jgi:DNA repair exonuclease SbcCD ATPase subunit
MKPSQDSPSPFPDETDDREFEQTLAEVERSLQALKARYAQVRADQQRQQQLQQQLSQTQRELRQIRSRELQAELQQIKQQLEELEVALESQLFSWNGLKEVFWQAVRFGGLGIVVGWLLRYFAE